MKNQIGLVILFILTFNGLSFSATENYYLEIGKENLEIGKYAMETFEAQPLATFSRVNFNPSEIAELLLKGSENEKVLFYIHSMWGSLAPYHKSSLKKLNSIENADRIISIVWHTDKLSYKGSWNLAINQGKSIAPIMQELLSISENENFLMSHSMGNRIFEGIALELEESDSGFSGVFLLAADLDVDVFSNNLSTLPQLSDQIFIYVNEKDKWLKPSKVIHGKGRLGLNAKEQSPIFCNFSNVEIVDVTHRQTPGIETSRSHVYFKLNQGVLDGFDRVIGGGVLSNAGQ